MPPWQPSSRAARMPGWHSFPLLYDQVRGPGGLVQKARITGGTPFGVPQGVPHPPTVLPGCEPGSGPILTCSPRSKAAGPASFACRHRLRQRLGFARVEVDLVDAGVLPDLAGLLGDAGAPLVHGRLLGFRVLPDPSLGFDDPVHRA